VDSQLVLLHAATFLTVSLAFVFLIDTKANRGEQYRTLDKILIGILEADELHSIIQMPS